MLNLELANGNGVARTAHTDPCPLVCKELTDLLNRCLADTLDLMLQAKQAHWTVTGVNFLGLHRLFDKISAAAGEFADLLAERIMQLGGRAEGTALAVVRISRLEPYPVTLSRSDEHLAQLATTLARYAQLMRRAIGECAHRGDAVSADLFTAISREADKWRWLVEAHKERR